MWLRIERSIILLRGFEMVKGLRSDEPGLGISTLRLIPKSNWCLISRLLVSVNHLLLMLCKLSLEVPGVIMPGFDLIWS